MKAVKVVDLTKKFGHFSAVDKISFEIKEGEIVGFLGPNGAGKTTTIMMLLGLIKPTSGRIEILGKNLNDYRAQILQKINFSSTYTSFRGRMTVFENLYVFGLIYGLKNPKEKVENLLKTFEITSLRNKQVIGLSSGEVTRVSLCKALLNNPRLLLLDEPTASLDPDIARKTREFLFKIRRKYSVSMLLTSHNMAEVSQMCDRIVFLSHGRIIAEDTPLNLTKMVGDCSLDLVFEAPLKETIDFCRREGFNFSIPQPNNLVVKLKEEEIAAVLEKISHSKVKITEIDIQKPDLEDVFVEIARRKR